MDPGTWTPEHGPRNMDPGTWTPEHGPLNMDPGTWTPEHGPRNMDPVRYMGFTFALVDRLDNTTFPWTPEWLSLINEYIENVTEECSVNCQGEHLYSFEKASSDIEQSGFINVFPTESPDVWRQGRQTTQNSSLTAGTSLF